MLVVSGGIPTLYGYGGSVDVLLLYGAIFLSKNASLRKRVQEKAEELQGQIGEGWNDGMS